jgi:hypothetical protein
MPELFGAYSFQESSSSLVPSMGAVPIVDKLDILPSTLVDYFWFRTLLRNPLDRGSLRTQNDEKLVMKKFRHGSVREQQQQQQQGPGSGTDLSESSSRDLDQASSSVREQQQQGPGSGTDL